MAAADAVFVYRGDGGSVPNQTTRLRVHSSVSVIRQHAFNYLGQLEKVELCEGVLEIGEGAFSGCESLKQITLPSTLKRIRKHAFYETSISSFSLHNNVESISRYAFCCSGLTKFRVPPLINTITEGMLSKCNSMCSVEFPESIVLIEGHPHLEDDEYGYNGALKNCHSLRNVTIPANTEVREGAFMSCTDLQVIFEFEQGFNSTEQRIINALKHRFDSLPIHKMIYYQSYNNLTANQLNSTTDIRISRRRSKLNPTGKQRDCLGMTPLHILACSTVQNVELYRVLIAKYPENIVTEDSWGALPLLYAVWGGAPNEIVQFLAESYLSLYPSYDLNWTGMFISLSQRNVQRDVVKSLLDLRQNFFPNQHIDWNTLLSNLHECGDTETRGTLDETFRFLVKCSIREMIHMIGLKQFREEMVEFVERGDINYIGSWEDARRVFVREVNSKLDHYKSQYLRLKEATALLELAMWKNEINDSSREKNRPNKKRKIVESDLRQQCRISSGADVVVAGVLPYLLPRPIVS